MCIAFGGQPTDLSGHALCFWRSGLGRVRFGGDFAEIMLRCGKRRSGGHMAEIWWRSGGDLAENKTKTKKKPAKSGSEIWRRSGGDLAEIWRTPT